MNSTVIHDVSSQRVPVSPRFAVRSNHLADGDLLNWHHHPALTQIVQQFDYRCMFCGFRDEKFIELHFVDLDEKNHSKSNIRPACSLCRKQHHLFDVGIKRSAELALIPNIKQTDLNHIQRYYLVLAHHPEEKIRNQFGHQSFLESLLLQAQRQLVANKEPSETGTPSAEISNTQMSVLELANALILAQQSNKNIIQEFNSEPLKLIYNYRIFKQEQIDYYLSLPEFQPKNWPRAIRNHTTVQQK